MGEDELERRIHDLERRLAAIEIDGSPNMRERVAKLEGRMNHLTDPEEGIYPEMRQTTERLRTWALVLLTFLTVNLLLIIVHLASTHEIP